jgi:hypothetical protein
MIQSLPAALAISLILTLALETGFFFATGKRDKKDLLLLILVNILTNPAVVLTYWLMVLYTGWNAVIIIIPLEIFAVLTEGFYYKKYGRCFKRPYFFSLAANAFSYGTGVLLQYFM